MKEVWCDFSTIPHEENKKILNKNVAAKSKAYLVLQ